MKRLVWGFAAALLTSLPAPASADIIQLVELAINVDGTVHDSFGPPVLPLSFPGFDDSAFDYDTGLGVISITVSGAGAHYVAAFYDHDLIDDDPNGDNTFADDSGEVLGAPPAGVAWEIDEPGFGVSYTGDIFTNFEASALDEMIFDGVITEEDTSMALSWAFLLGADETALLTFVTSTADPGGFRLHQFDEFDDVYLSGTLRIDDQQVPEPALLVLVGLGALTSARRWRHR